MLQIKKEIRFGIRNSKFLILAAGFLFFALLDPVMTKVILPAILKSQFPAAADAFAAMMDTTQLGCLQTYMGDIFEMGTIIVVFTLCGAVAQELKEYTLVLPVCSGKSFRTITAAKLAVFGTALVIIPVVALLADYAYAGVLMGFDITATPVLIAGVIQGLYMVFILSSLMMFGSFVKKPIAAGILTLIAAYGLYFVGGAIGIEKYLPSGMLSIVQQFSSVPDSSVFIPAAITAGIVTLLYVITVMRLKSIELSAK